MNEESRRARNAQRLAELHSTYAGRIGRLISQLEAAGYRPRIQDAWRSPESQLAAFEAGTSKLTFGFHNLTTADGRPDSLAVDLLDDDSPLASRTAYLLQLAAAARTVQCQTGIGWGLPQRLRDAVQEAIASGNWNAAVKVGWDPTHVEPADVTLAEARAGKRPSSGVRRRAAARVRARTGRRTAGRQKRRIEG